MHANFLKTTIVILLLVGCSTASLENKNRILNTWIGQTEEKVISRWGLPTSTYQTGDKKYLTYTVSTSGYIPSIGGAGGLMPGININNYCSTTLILQKSIVVDWSYKGNACESD